MRLLEREEALAALHEHAASATQGHGRVVLVYGEAGAGKSALLEYFATTTQGMRWLRGACDGLFTPRPLAPLFDLADDLGGELLAACAGGAPRDTLFRQLLSALGDGNGPYVLAVEDVHWADESTLDLLAFLGRRMRDLPVLLICTYRDDELGAGHPLRLVLGELASSRVSRRVSLAPLSIRAVTELASGTDVEPGELHRLSGGNPFFVSEVLQSGRSGVPLSARDAVLARLVRLTPPTRQVAETAALVGARLDLPLLEALVPVATAEIDELLDSGLIVSDHDGLRFRHELGRLAVEQEVPAHRRRTVHAATLAWLVAAGCEDGARLAYHAEGAEDRAAVALFAPRAAATAAGLGAHREAAVQCERALRFSDPEDVREVAKLYDLLMREASLTDDWARAAEAGDRALELWRSLGETRREGSTLQTLSRASWRLCRPGSLRLAEDALALLEPLGPWPELAWALAGMAKALMEQGCGHDGIALARRAQELASTLGLPDALADALITESCLVYADGDVWRPLMQRAVDVALEAGAHEQVGRAYANLWIQLLGEGQLVECDRVIDFGARYCDEHDLRTYEFCLRTGRATSLLARGRWSDSVTQSLPLWTSGLSSPANRTMLAVTLGLAWARQGDARSRVCLDEALERARESGVRGWVLSVLPASAEAHWLAGDLASAQADLAAVVEAFDGDLPAAAIEVAAWCRRVGMEEPAIRGPRTGHPTHLLLAGDWAAAAAGFDGLGMPYEAALACHDSGSAVGLRDALHRFEQLGATAAVGATRRQMRRLGVRVGTTGQRAATRAHPLGLTRREAEVLDGITAGDTNAQIAERLFLSARTVDHHVSSLLSKLGVESRAEAVRVAAQYGSALGQN